MTRWLARLLPSRASAQIATIVVGSVLLANLLTAIVLLVVLPPQLRRTAFVPPHATELVALARALHAVPDRQAREIVLDSAIAANSRIARGGEPVPASGRPPPPPDRDMLEQIATELSGVGVPFLLPGAAGEPGPPAVGVRLSDGTTLNISPRQRLEAPPRPIVFHLIITMASLAVLLAMLSWWAARAVVAPLERLAASVDRFDPDRDEISTLGRGPAEVRRLARAFGDMASRIRKLLDGRTQMLAAISHDLRTPITRLRLRAEEIPDRDRRRAMQADLALMERMVGSALSYLRDGRASAAMTATNLAALLQTVCDDFADLGHGVVYEGPDHASAICDADQMTRAVANLVDNAIKFGGRTVVRLEDGEPGLIAVAVEDAGSGIPADEREKVLEPFYRSDTARTLRPDSGFGLGLAIVSAIAEAHGGSLALSERPGGGLRAVVAWPRGPVPPASPPPATGER